MVRPATRRSTLLALLGLLGMSSMIVALHPMAQLEAAEPVAWPTVPWAGTPPPVRGTITITPDITTIGKTPKETFTIRVTGGPPNTVGLICGVKDGVPHCNAETRFGKIKTDASGNVANLNAATSLFSCSRPNDADPELPQHAPDQHIEWFKEPYTPGDAPIGKTNVDSHSCQTSCAGTRTCTYAYQRQCRDSTTPQVCNPMLNSGCGGWVDTNACLASCRDGRCIGSYMPDGSGTSAGALLMWLPPEEAGSLGRFAAAWETATCTTAETNPKLCEVDDPAFIASRDLTVNFRDGAGPDLRIYANEWAPVKVYVEGIVSPVKVLETTGAPLFQDIDIGKGTPQSVGKSYTKITLKLALDHTKGAVNFEVKSLRALNGGTGEPVTGLTNEQQQYEGRMAFSVPPADEQNCTTATGQKLAYFIPDGSGECTNAPGVFLDLPGQGIAYVPSWKTKDCGSTCKDRRRASCVVRDTGAFADRTVQLAFPDHTGPDVKVTIPASGTIHSQKFFVPGDTAARATTGGRLIEVRATGKWVTSLVFSSTSPIPVSILGTDAVAQTQLVDFRKEPGSLNGFILRATNAGSFCSGLLVSNVEPTDEPAPPNPNAVCPNGIRERSEECDGEDLGGISCRHRGFTGGQLRCSSTCRFSTARCTGTQQLPPVIPPPPQPPPPPPPPVLPKCGDNLIQESIGEVCDGSDLSGRLCSSYGFISGTIRCSDDCRSVDLTKCVGIKAETITECTPGTPGCNRDEVSVPPSAAPIRPEGATTRQLANWLIGISGGLSVLYVIYGGLQYIAAGTDEEKVKHARRTMRNAIIGVVIVLFAYVIVLGLLRLVYSAG